MAKNQNLGKNISEIIFNSKEYTDDSYDSYFYGIMKEFLGGDNKIYGYSWLDEYNGKPAHGEIILMAEHVKNIDAAIAAVWKGTGLEPESEDWNTLPNYSIIYVTDKEGNIIKETPRRYY